MQWRSCQKYLVAVVLACGLSTTAFAQGENNFDPDEKIPYILNVKGLDQPMLYSRFLEASLLHAERTQKGAQIDSRARLRSRLASDVATLTALAHSEGYYDCAVAPQIAPAPGARGTVVVVLAVSLGEQFHFGTINLGTTLTPDQRAAAKDLVSGAPARSAVVLALDQIYATLLPQQGYPFYLLGKRDVVVDHATKTVDITWPIDPGPRTRIGDIRFVGAPVAKPAHLMKLAQFKSGAIFDSRLIDDFRQSLLGTGLYGTLNVYPQYVRDGEDGVAIADILVDGQPTTLHSLSFVVGYNTREGPRSEVNWQHRNLFGAQEQLSLRGVVGTIEQSAQAELRKLNAGKIDQTLLARVSVIHQDNDALEAISYSLLGGIERQNLRFLQRRWTYSSQVALGIDDVRRGGTLGRFYTASLPASFRFDGTNDLFDPTRGFRAGVQLVPEIAVRKGTHAYVLTDAQVSGYKTLGTRLPITLSARLRIGSILGSDLEFIPATRRFYAGGGGSIRGYNYQGISPRDADGNPTGGRAVSEFSVEARFKLTPTLGIVPFLDGGAVYTDALPRVSNYRWGAGLGLRYFTGFAPLRVDVATSLNRRTGDPAVALYVSLGQSF